MERVADEANLIEALRRVCANKGSAGVDGMDVTELKAWMSVRAHRESKRDKLISGEYEPAPVRGVQIPKPGGKGVRQLGIPTVVVRPASPSGNELGLVQERGVTRSRSILS
jgi:RNA-directed DNA polymerase